MNTHHFETTHDAYNESQWNEEIKHGDILVVASEGVIGILFRAWPTAIVYDEDPGAFHTRADETSDVIDGEDMSASIREAKDIAESDADITGNEHWRNVS